MKLINHFSRLESKNKFFCPSIEEEEGVLKTSSSWLISWSKAYPMVPLLSKMGFLSPIEKASDSIFASYDSDLFISSWGRISKFKFVIR